VIPRAARLAALRIFVDGGVMSAGTSAHNKPPTARCAG